MLEKRTIKARYCGNNILGRDLVSLTREILSSKDRELQQREKDLRRNLAQHIWNLRGRAQKSTNRILAAKNNRALAALKLERERVYQQTSKQAKVDCIKLALQIAREVIASEIKSNAKSLTMRVETAIDTLLDTRKIQVLVNTQDLQKVQHEFDVISPGLTLSKSDDVSPGNARIITENGEIDLSWEAHFDLIQEHLLNSAITNG